MPSAYWRFDEGRGNMAGDSAGGAAGSLMSGASWSNGIRGAALSLDGKSGYVDVGNRLRITSPNFTIEAWINGDPHMEAFGRIIDSGYSTGFALGAGGDSRTILFEYRGSPYLVSKSIVIDNTWHHVAIVKSGNTATLYVDGIAQGNVMVNPDPPTNTLPTFIGYNPGEGTRGHWKGLIDEVRVYYRALTAAEVQADYNAR